MRTIDLLGGMSFEGTATYYRLISEAIRQRRGGLNSADIIMHSINFSPVAEMQLSGRWDEAGTYLADRALGLERAGANCVLVCAVTMHLVADAVEQALNVPFIHIIDETAYRLLGAGHRRPLLIATRYTMENGFYQERMARHGVEIIVPAKDDRSIVHDIIFDELCQGKIVTRSREALITMIERAKAAGADSIIFGCTEIGLILDPEGLPLRAYDSTAIHAAAAVEFALQSAVGPVDGALSLPIKSDRARSAPQPSTTTDGRNSNDP